MFITWPFWNSFGIRLRRRLRGTRLNMTLNPTLDRTLKLSLTWLRLIHPLRRSYMDRKNGKPPTDSAEDPYFDWRASVPASRGRGGYMCCPWRVRWTPHGLSMRYPRARLARTLALPKWCHFNFLEVRSSERGLFGTLFGGRLRRRLRITRRA